MCVVIASRAFKLPRKMQNGLRWLQKYYFLVLYVAQLHIYFSTCTILRKCLIMHNVCWDHSWVEVNRRLCCITFDYQQYFILLPISLTVTWQLLLVSCNAKIIQLPCCNSSYKGARGALHKQLCWEFGVSTIVFVLL